MKDLGINLTPGINASLDKTSVFLSFPPLLKREKWSTVEQRGRNTNTQTEKNPTQASQKVLARK